METWDEESTAKWLCRIGLDKYASICQKEAINGQALLLLASKSTDQLVSVFRLKKGPQKILLNSLLPLLKAFDQSKPQTMQTSMETISEWTVEKLQNWLKELHIPEDCLIEVEKEEINGKALLLLRESGELKDCLHLKVGSWIVLEHELFLHLEKGSNIKSGTTMAMSTTENIIPKLDVETNPSTKNVLAMETWDEESTAKWLCRIGLDKYASICQKEAINGRALLLLASKSTDQLVLVFRLNKGPQKILLNYLLPLLKAFDQSKPQTMQNSLETISEWTVEKLQNWLKELHIPEDCLIEVEKEEINGKALLLLRESGELKDCLHLKVGSWIVLEHELFLRLEKGSNIESGTTMAMSATENIILKLDVETTPSTKNVLETSFNQEEKQLLLLQNSLKLDIAFRGSENMDKCVIRCIYFKRGADANALEKMFRFIVVTKDEMTSDKPRQLWSQIVKKTATWVTLLPEKDVPSSKNALRGRSATQIYLGNFSDDEYKQGAFVILVDKHLLTSKKTYNFLFDKKQKFLYSIKLNFMSKYHASFDPNSPSQDFKFSEHLISLMTNTCTDPEQSTCNPSRYELPRPFGSELENYHYNEGFVFSCWETSSKDLIKPVHEFKVLQRGNETSENFIIDKFVAETLRFACGCLNERTNGTIHFGIADEQKRNKHGRQCRQIVGLSVTNEKKPHYNEKLTEFIDKWFVGQSRSNVHHCIRPPVFIPVLPSDNKVVIEVDIEPRYSFCEGEVFITEFKRPGHEKEQSTAYIRHDSQTRGITDILEMVDYKKNCLPKLDEERKKREQEQGTPQGMEKQDSLKHLNGKLKRLMCANKKVLDSSIYPILVLNQPSASMNQDFLNKTFHFIQNIKWQVIIDFDDQGSDSNGLCSVFKSGPHQCELHEAEDYNKDNALIERIYHATHWIFANGFAKIGNQTLRFKQWNNSKRKRGLSQVIQSLANEIPVARAVVLFLLFSKECEPMADTFKDFCTFFDGPNQLLYVAEFSEMVTDWVEKLSSTCLEEHELQDRGVVGMSWSEFQECMQQMIRETDRHQRYITMATETLFPLNITFNNIDIISAKECNELRDKSRTELFQISSEAQNHFYKGYPVTWGNFWFTDQDGQNNHVLRRDNYSDLKRLIEKMHAQGFKGKVQTITIYHHIGAGASTMARQALWDFRCDSHFPCRCAVVTKIDDSTCKELLRLRKIGYEEDSEALLPPVLALVEDTDDLLFQELRSQVFELCHRYPKPEWPVCIFLYCKPTQNPRECHCKEMETSVYLEQHLSSDEIKWFKNKYTEMKGKFHQKDPECCFETYANENLISFMIMQENFNPKYASSIVERHLEQVTDNELTVLKYTSLLNIYNPNPVFASCFDTIMLSFGLLRRNFFWDWVENLSHSARIFLREKDCSPSYGTGKAISIVHPIIASELLGQIAKKNGTSVSEIAVEFLKSPLLANERKSFPLAYLRDGANRMLKHRRKYEYGNDIQTKFSPLIEKILYVRDPADGIVKATEQSISKATDVLKEGLDKFDDPMLAQQMARVIYVNAEYISKPKIDSCFSKALEFCEKAIEMSPANSFFIYTMGCIHKSKMERLYGPLRRDRNLIEIDEVTPALPLAFDAMKWFQKSVAASMDYQNENGFHGELSVMFFLLDVIRCARIFRGQDGLKKLQGYLAYCQVIPSEVQIPWSDFHEGIKNVRKRYNHCMEGLAEVFAIYKVNSLEEKMLPKQIASFKARYLSYFGEGDVDWNTESPEERWEYRWYQINQHLAGGIFSSVFNFNDDIPRKTLQSLKKLAEENCCEPVKEHYNDLLLIITTTMALHSPYGKGFKDKSAMTTDEYRDIYKLVEQLFLLEECDDARHKRLYAHLLKVMFLWPRKDLELINYRVQDFYDCLKKLEEGWNRKCNERNEMDKIMKQQMYKYMTFRREKGQYTTLFYLGKGSGLDVFVHINELAKKGSPDWENRKTKQRLERLTGVVESKNIIRVQNPLDSSKTIKIYYSSFCEGGFSKEEVSFYLGFSWAHPMAFDVKYTKDNRKHPVKLSDSFPDDPVKFLPKYDDLTYKEYTSNLVKLQRSLQEIAVLKERKEDGQELEKNQEKKIKTEGEMRKKLEDLKERFDAQGVFEEEIFY